MDNTKVWTLPKGENRTDDQKKEIWSWILGKRIDQFRSMYAAANNEDAKKAIQETSSLETDGGNCPECGAPWIEVKFDNRFLAGRYFKPGCECYPCCPNCGRSLYDCDATGELRKTWDCPNCGWRLMVGNEKRYGSAYAAGRYAMDWLSEIFKKLAAWKKRRASRKKRETKESVNEN